MNNAPAKYVPVGVAFTAMVVSCANTVYLIKKLNDMQAQLDDLSDSIEKDKEDTSKKTLVSTETQAQLHTMQNTLQELLGRTADNEEEGITTQGDLDGIAANMQDWAARLVEEFKVVKPESRLEVPSLMPAEPAPTSRAPPAGRRGINNPRAHHHHNSRKHGREEEDIEARFQRRRR